MILHRISLNFSSLDNQEETATPYRTPHIDLYAIYPNLFIFQILVLETIWAPRIPTANLRMKTSPPAVEEEEEEGELRP